MSDNDSSEQSIWKCARCGERFRGYDAYECHDCSGELEKPWPLLKSKIVENDRPIEPIMNEVEENDEDIPKLIFLEKSPCISSPVILRKKPEFKFVIVMPNCDGCGSGDVFVDFDRGDLVCSKCGLVITRIGVFERQSIRLRRKTMHIWGEKKRKK